MSVVFFFLQAGKIWWRYLQGLLQATLGGDLGAGTEHFLKTTSEGWTWNIKLVSYSPESLDYSGFNHCVLLPQVDINARLIEVGQ